MTARASGGLAEPIRVARIISRLNIGGPAIQAITLTKEMEPLGYRTLLVRGQEGHREGSMDYLAAESGVRPIKVASMSREIGLADAAAFMQLVRLLRGFQPHLVHTHLAKAGTIGRAATVAAFPRRPPVLVHTYHGHSLTGYFSSRRSGVFKRIERGLGCRTDRLIAVSEEIRDELVALGVAPSERFRIVRLGFDLERFVFRPDDEERQRSAVRAEFGISDGAPVVTMFARLVPIKRVDRFLKVAQIVATAVPDVRFVIAGDGELREELRRTKEATTLGDRVVWTGFRRDVPQIAAASDVIVQTSDNEGTPVSLIEAHASGRAVVSTRVGGAASVVRDGESGLLVDVGDEPGLAEAVIKLLREENMRRAMGATGREHVLDTFAMPRLVGDMDALYRNLLDPGGEEDVSARARALARARPYRRGTGN